MYIRETTDVERFTGLNIHDFNPSEVFTEILLHYLCQKYILFNIIKERHYIQGKTFTVFLKTTKTAKL